MTCWLRHAAWTAWRDTLVTTSATCMTRVQGCRHSAHVHLTFSDVFPEIDANLEHKRLNLYMRTLLLLRHLP